MPRPIPVPDAISKPFWDAVNEERLVVQRCTACNSLQYPPAPKCRDCASDALEWKETRGLGHIVNYVVVVDGLVGPMVPDQPFNLAVIALDEDPRINFYSNLPGVPVRQVPVGAAVQVTFEQASPDQKVHEWRLVG